MESGPTFTLIAPRKVLSSFCSSSSAPGRQLTTRCGSVMYFQTRSTGACTSKRSSILKAIDHLSAAPTIKTEPILHPDSQDTHHYQQQTDTGNADNMKPNSPHAPPAPTTLPVVHNGRF